jgi:hypothetical protein
VLENFQETFTGFQDINPLSIFQNVMQNMQNFNNTAGQSQHSTNGFLNAENISNELQVMNYHFNGNMLI